MVQGISGDELSVWVNTSVRFSNAVTECDNHYWVPNPTSRFGSSLPLGASVSSALTRQSNRQVTMSDSGSRFGESSTDNIQFHCRKVGHVGWSLEQFMFSIWFF